MGRNSHFSGCAPKSPAWPGLWQALDEIAPAEEKGDRARRIGKRLAKWRGRVVEGKKLASVTDRTGVQVWTLVA
jgi:hypothetical protein